MPVVKKIKIAVIVFYCLLFVGLALYDEKPSPQYIKEMARPRPEVVELGNGWIAMLGIDAPFGVSPFAYGVKKMRRVEAVFSSKNFDEYRNFLLDNLSKKDKLEFKGKMPSMFGAKDDGAFRYEREHAKELAALLHDNHELIRRFEALRSYPRFTEPVDCGSLSPLPNYLVLRDVEATRIAQMAMEFEAGNRNEALSELRQDMEYWRFESRNSSTLISKMVNFAVTGYSLRFAAEVGATGQLGIREYAQIYAILRPFNGGENTLTSAMRGEMRGMLEAIDLTFYWSPKHRYQNLDSFLRKRQATKNELSAIMLTVISLSEMTPKEYSTKGKKIENDFEDSWKIGASFIFNPAGQSITKLVVPNFSKMIERGYDLEGLRRLAWLKVLAHQQKIPLDGMQRFLDSHAGDYGDPFTGKPMRWDGKKKRIFFPGGDGDEPVAISY